MRVKGIVTSTHCCLVIFLILSDLPSLHSSPIPMLEEFLNRKSSALPSEEQGKLSQEGSNALLVKVVSTERNRDTSRSLGSLKTAQNGLKSAQSPQRNALPAASRADKSLMQMRVNVPRPSFQGDFNLNDPASKVSGSGGLPLGSDNERSAKQPWEFLPIKPQEEKDGESGNIPLQIKVDYGSSEHAKNSVVTPQAKPVLYGHELPISSGSNIMNLGRLNLKTDWCNAHPFKETVRHHGCESVEIDNNMCYGQCNSFYIPKRFFSCSYCAPSREETVSVRLECPGKNPSSVIKKVKIVLDCACKDCGLPQS